MNKERRHLFPNKDKGDFSISSQKFTFDRISPEKDREPARYAGFSKLLLVLFLYFVICDPPQNVVPAGRAK